MAKVTLQEIAKAYNVSPGTVHHWWWNNAPDKRLWLFSADAHPITLSLPNVTYSVEVIRVENRLKANFNVREREIHVWLKNTGNIPTNYVLYMSSIG